MANAKKISRAIETYHKNIDAKKAKKNKVTILMQVHFLIFSLMLLNNFRMKSSICDVSLVKYPEMCATFG